MSETYTDRRARVVALMGQQRAKLPAADVNGHARGGYHVDPNGPGYALFGDPRELADDAEAQAARAGRYPTAGELADAAPPAAPPPSAPAAPVPRTPRADPSQGAHGIGTPTRAQQAAAAQAAGNVREALRLINEPIHLAREMGLSPQEWTMRFDQ